jgi:hypothetical protein
VRDYGIFGLTLILGGGFLLINGPQKQPTQGQSSAKGSPVKEKLVCPAVLPSDCMLTFSWSKRGSRQFYIFIFIWVSR